LVRQESSFPHLFYQGIIFRVRTDPEPYGGVFHKNTNGTPMNPDPDGIDEFTGMDALELEGRMTGI
jgi:hypothetical protein